MSFQILTISLNQDCEQQSIYLTWINNLGGWEYWNFTARKEYGIDFENSNKHEENIFSDWDDSFINGDTIETFTNISARNTRHVRSQYITQSQLDSLVNLRHSIKVQEIRTDGSKITVLVDKNGFRIRQDKDKLFMIEFDLIYTDKIPVQDA